MAGFLDFLLGSEGKFRQSLSQFSPEQQNILQNLLQQGSQGLGTEAIEEQARRNYRQNTIPLLSERFAQSGGIGSSGYQNAIQGVGTELETNLAALRQGNAMNLLNLGLTPQGQTYFEPGQQGILGDLVKAAADTGLAYATGGTSLAATGGQGITGLFQRLFNRGNQGQQALTGIQAEATSPLRQRLQSQSPVGLLGQSAGLGGGLNQSLFTGGRFLGEQPQARTQVEAYNQAQRPGVFNAISLLNQAYQGGLPGAARRSDLLAALAQPRLGFEL